MTAQPFPLLTVGTSADITALEILDTGGRFYYLALGAAASEVDTLLITPGGNGIIPVTIPSGTRLSIKAIDGTADAGYTGFNAYG